MSRGPECRVCAQPMRRFYDALGAIVIGLDCPTCGRTTWLRDAALPAPDDTSARRYEPAPVASAPDVPVPDGLAADATTRVCAWAPCSEPFVPKTARQRFSSEACRHFAVNAIRQEKTPPERRRPVRSRAARMAVRS